MDWRERFLTSVGPGLLGGITLGQWSRLPRQERLAMDLARLPPEVNAGINSMWRSTIEE